MNLEIKIKIPFMPAKDVLFSRYDFFLKLESNLKKKLIFSEKTNFVSNRDYYYFSSTIKKIENFEKIKGPLNDSPNALNFKKKIPIVLLKIIFYGKIPR